MVTPESVDVLNDEELGLLRGEIIGWMPDLCDVYRITETDDVYGGVSDTESLVLSGITCEVQSGVALRQEEIIAEKVQAKQIFTVTLPVGTDVHLEDHLVITSRGDLHLMVQAVFAPESWELETRVVGSVEAEHLA
jgi:hypothetical protein